MTADFPTGLHLWSWRETEFEQVADCTPGAWISTSFKHWSLSEAQGRTAMVPSLSSCLRGLRQVRPTALGKTQVPWESLIISFWAVLLCFVLFLIDSPYIVRGDLELTM